MRTLVLGIGNLLLCDEGVGVHVIHALQQQQLPTDVVAVEAGTAFLDVISDLAEADRVVVVDAMQGGEAPGTIYRVPFEDCARPEVIAGLHGLDLSRMSYLSGRETDPEIVVIGVEPGRIDWGTELSPEVQKAVPDVIEAVKIEIGC